MQATIGQCNIKRPGAFDFVGRAKWDAWNGLGDLSMVCVYKQGFIWKWGGGGGGGVALGSPPLKYGVI